MMANARRRTQRTTRTIARNMAGAATAAATTVDADDARSSRTMNWQNELKYINHDLRYLLTISTILFVLLFVIGFFL